MVILSGTCRYYNIPSNNRELQRRRYLRTAGYDYNIPSNNRELQHAMLAMYERYDYNIPSNNRELQLS